MRTKFLAVALLAASGAVADSEAAQQDPLRAAADIALKWAGREVVENSAFALKQGVGVTASEIGSKEPWLTVRQPDAAGPLRFTMVLPADLPAQAGSSFSVRSGRVAGAWDAPVQTSNELFVSGQDWTWLDDTEQPALTAARGTAFSRTQGGQIRYRFSASDVSFGGKASSVTAKSVFADAFLQAVAAPCTEPCQNPERVSANAFDIVLANDSPLFGIGKVDNVALSLLPASGGSSILTLEAILPKGYDDPRFPFALSIATEVEKPIGQLAIEAVAATDIAPFCIAQSMDLERISVEAMSWSAFGAGTYTCSASGWKITAEMTGPSVAALIDQATEDDQEPTGLRARSRTARHSFRPLTVELTSQGIAVDGTELDIATRGDDSQ